MATAMKTATELPTMKDYQKNCNKFSLNKVAILGSGVMGAQIAAHFANANFMVVLFDLKATDAHRPNANIEKSLTNLTKIKPAALALPSRLDFIEAANYDDNLSLLTECDLVIEAIAEKLEWKEELYHKIAPYLKENVIIASNTSGLSIEVLASSLPHAFRHRFCGIHFFNPPRYMALVELIPHKGTDAQLLINLESFLVTNLGKSVVIAKDTPNFVANRLGVFSMLVACIHTKAYNIPLEVVDQLTGKIIGRPSSATYRTADIVGLDTLAHVIDTLTIQCQGDGFSDCYHVPEFISKLIAAGSLGAKTKKGIYQKSSDGSIQVLDLNTGDYRPSNTKANEEVLAILRLENWQKRLAGLRECQLPQAQFLWACFRDIFHYAATLLGVIANSVDVMDLAMRNGFGWKEGIFEIWQQAGFLQVALWLKEDIAHGKTLSQVALPEWLFKQDVIYGANECYNVVYNKLLKRDLLPVYKRQLFPELLLNETPSTQRHVVFENDAVVLWHSGDDIAILSFKTKMCTINMAALLGIDEAISIAEHDFSALVIWQQKDIFSAGANLEEFGFAFMMNGVNAINEVIDMGHKVVAKRLRYCKVPVVAAVRGYAFGGGCEIMLHCDKVVAALESYIGLVEAGVGLLPGWGGTTEMARRASQSADPWRAFTEFYKNLALAKVATSALEAREMGFLQSSDVIVMNTREVLFIAKEEARLLALKNYQPPVATKFKVFGDQGIANVQGLLANMLEGKQISSHDHLIASSIAYVMCGSGVENGSQVSEDFMLNVEKSKFQELALTEKTAMRIQHMLEKGKPLRN